MPTVNDIVQSLHCEPDLDTIDDNGDSLPTITYEKARNAFQNIQTFLYTSSNCTESTYQLLHQLDVLLSQSCIH